MKIFTHNSKLIFASFFILTGFILFFQNCSVVNFGRDYNQVELSSQSNYYVNTRFINIDVKTNADIYKKMKVSLQSDLSSTKWQPTVSHISFDLAEEYSNDGSKDGEKTIYM